MRDRLFAAWMTYWTRPFVQAFCGLWLLLLLLFVLATVVDEGSILQMGHVFLFQGVGLMFLLLGFHATSQFTQYASRLTPGFNRPHQIVAVGIVMGMAMMGAVIGAAQGYSPLHSFGLMVIMAAVFVWFGYMLASQARRPQRPHTLFQIVIGICGAVIGGGAFIPLLYSQRLETFLDGSSGPMPALLLILIGVVAVVQWALLLPKEAKRFAASNATTAFTWKDHQQRMMRITSTADGQPLQQWGYGASDRFLVETLSIPPRGIRNNVRLRRAGTTRTLRTVLIFAIFLPVFSWLIQSVILLPTNVPNRYSSSVGSMSWFLMYMFVLMATQFVGGAWRQRMASMATESLWPATRSRLRLVMFLSILIDFTPIAVCSLLYSLILMALRSPQESSDTFHSAILCGWLLLNTSLFAFMMWALIQRSTATIWAGAILHHIAGTAVMMGYVLASFKEGVVTVGLVLGATSVISSGVAMGAAYVWRRWATVEFGRLDQ